MAADTVLVVISVLYAFGWYVSLLENPAKDPDRMTGFFLVAVLASCALWVRRRWPVGVAVVLLPVTLVDDLASGAMLSALLTVAIHRPVRITALVCTARVLSVVVFLPLRAGTAPEVQWALAFAVVSSVGVVGWGLFVRHRRQLIVSLRERAARAEVEARLRAEQAQHRAREEIAREMHDVLGHRLSLLSVHAGALEYRPDAPPEEVARAAAVIRETAHQALQDLREVIGVLRAPVGELPQPTYADLRELVAESVRGGMQVELRDEVTAEVPGRLGRTAYRIVQEALTNARKHAPGAQVSVELSGGPGEGLAVDVRNTAAQGPAAEAGAGNGLTGLAERVALAGGRIRHGPVAGGGFAVSAWLPWPP